MIRTVCIILAAALGTVGLTGLVSARQLQPAAAFERLKALDVEWIDVDGALGAKGKVGAIYRVTCGGTAVIERVPIGSSEEMTTCPRTKSGPCGRTGPTAGPHTRRRFASRAGSRKHSVRVCGADYVA